MLKMRNTPNFSGAYGKAPAGAPKMRGGDRAGSIFGAAPIPAGALKMRGGDRILQDQSWRRIPAGAPKTND